MKVKIENLGVLKKAEFEVGDLTIICGENGTGKTYASYALYGFLKFWHEEFYYDFLNEEEINSILEFGSLKIMIDDINNKVPEIISKAVLRYEENLSKNFGSSDKMFLSSRFEFFIDNYNIIYKSDFIDFSISSESLKITLNFQKNSNDDFSTIYVKNYLDVEKRIWIERLNLFILEVIFTRVFGYHFESNSKMDDNYNLNVKSSLGLPFMASIERTGATTFQRELDIVRNQVLDGFQNYEGDIDKFDFQKFRDVRRYSRPVKDDVDFNRNLFDFTKYESFISKEHPEILEVFHEILNGRYHITQHGTYFIPKGSNISMTMPESASSVRSLLNLGVYLEYNAQYGDILMIDEPELNLHPKNQRAIARLLAMLVNVGIKVFITTHSDYIIREFNTLIMLKDLKSKEEAAALKIMEDYKYSENELLGIDNLKVYIAKNETLEKALVDEQEGIEIESFDETIREMNKIQDKVMFG